MANLSVNILDIGVAGMFLLGALVGLGFGFVRGGLFVMSWVGATAATFFAFPLLKPITRQYIEAPWMADLATGVAVFLVALIILFLISSVIGGWVRTSRLNALDRSLGMLAGLVVAAGSLSGGYIFAESIWPEDKQPPWLQEARSTPLIRQGAAFLVSIVPKEIAVLGRDATNSAASKTKDALEREKAFRRLIGEADNKPADQRPGYDTKERREMDRVIDNVP